MNIEPVITGQKNQWIDMAIDLWPFLNRDELSIVFDDIQQSPNAISFVAYIDPHDPVAFINVSLRTDYVEGTSTSSVGYIEGIYVKPAYRLRSIAAALVRSAENWSREKGCTEMGSDAELDNVTSQQFHEALGFEEANRIVCYSKRI